MNSAQIHGLMQFVAFAIIFPLGGAIALFRNSLGSWWLRAHIILQTIGTLLVFAAIVIIKWNHSHNHDSTKDVPILTELKLHRILGPIIVLLLVAQWTWAIVAKRYLSASLTWDRWLAIHMILAVSIVGLGWVQVYLGIRMKNKAAEAKIKNEM